MKEHIEALRKQADEMDAEHKKFFSEYHRASKLFELNCATARLRAAALEAEVAMMKEDKK